MTLRRSWLIWGHIFLFILGTELDDLFTFTQIYIKREKKLMRNLHRICGITKKPY